MNNFLNIINFVRGFSPDGKDAELVLTTKKELEICRKFSLPNTFLLQYDALIRKDFREIFFGTEKKMTELGVWLEIVKPLAEACGIKWRGRPGMDWDWYVNPGFLQAYTHREREMLCDEVMSRFKEIYGFFPVCVGSWLLDSYSMDYLSRKYDIKAFVICREQWAVDAYTLWGGYYNQGYYPSKKNMLSPAQTKAEQINVPVFRMLGIDPIYEYDNRRYETKAGKWEIPYPIYTMEPVWKMGQSKECMQWFMDTYFNDKTVNFAYAQVGQENSFCWDEIKEGYKIQTEMVARLWEEGKICVQKLSETGEWFKAHFCETPPTSIVAQTDWSDNGLESIWYSCKNYRANIFRDNDMLWIRDIYKFDENYKERYYDSVCMEWSAVYDNLPVADGMHWKDEGMSGGFVFEGTLKTVAVEKSDNKQIITAGFDDCEEMITLSEEGIKIKGAKKLMFSAKEDKAALVLPGENGVNFEYNGFRYFVHISGKICPADNGFEITPENEEIIIKLN